jgi:ribonucleoside-diphosphate reductase alpha chain
MQASVQQYTDNAVSKTLTVSEDYPYDLFRDLFKRAFELGLKGCTAYRRGSRRPALLSEPGSAAAGVVSEKMTFEDAQGRVEWNAGIIRLTNIRRYPRSFPGCP